MVELSLVKSMSMDARPSRSNLSSAVDSVKSLFIMLAPHRLTFKRNKYVSQTKLEALRATNWLKHMFTFTEVVDEDRVNSNRWRYTV